MANDAWGQLTWNAGLWGQQNDAIFSVTGFGLNTSQGQANYTPVDGWGRNNWGALGWGVNYANITAFPSGSQLNLSQGNVAVDAEVREGWGVFTWGLVPWGGEQDPEVGVLGQQLNTSLNSNLNFIITGSTDLTGQQLNITTGTVETFAPFIAEVTGQQLNILLNSVTGTQAWNDTEVDISMAIAEGEVDPSPDATVTGIGMTVALAVGTVVIGTANVSVTGEQLNISQGTAIGDANTLASVTGIGLNIGVGTVFAGGNTDVSITGNGLTVTLNSINNQIWTVINTGTAATWTEIDTAA